MTTEKALIFMSLNLLLEFIVVYKVLAVNTRKVKTLVYKTVALCTSGSIFANVFLRFLFPKHIKIIQIYSSDFVAYMIIVFLLCAGMIGLKEEKNMMEKILLGSSYLAQAIVMATIAFAVISTIYYLRYNKKIICQPGWIIKYIFLVYIATVGMVTRVLDITSWSYGGFTAWNIVPFVNESWKLMLLNTLMFLPMGLLFPYL